MVRTTIKREIAVVFLYMFGFCVVTYPLVAHMSTAILGTQNSDAPLFVWNAWEMLHQFTHGGLSLWTQDVLFPHSLSLLFHTYTPVNSIVVLVIDAVFHNLILSSNLFFVVASVGAAYAMYRWVLMLFGDSVSAFFAGLFFAFQPLWSVYANAGTQSLLTLWFLPVVFLCVQTAIRRKHMWWAGLAGGVMGLAFWNDVYPFVFCAAGLLLYVVGLMLARTLPLRRGFALLATAYGVAFAVILPKLLLLVRHVSAFAGDAHPSIADVDVYHADVLNMLRPSAEHLFLGGLSTVWTHAASSQGNAFLGLATFAIVLGVVVRCVVYKRPLGWKKLHTVFAACTIVAMVLSWGPILHLFGVATGIPLPSWVFYRVFPFLTEIRVPLRWLFLVFFFLAPLLALVLRDALASMRIPYRILIVGMLCLLCVADVAYIPRPLMDTSAQEYDVYRVIARDSAGTLKEGAVLDIPLSMSSGFFHLGEPQQQRSMLAQTIHEYPITAGHMSRIPRSLEVEYTQAPVLRYFLSLPDGPNASPQDSDRDPKPIQNFLQTYQPRYIVVHTADFERVVLDELDTYLTQSLGFTNIYEDSATRLYRNVE